MTFSHKKSLNNHLEDHLKPKNQKTQSEPKMCRRRASKASKLTAIELEENEAKELMSSDLLFRKQLNEMNENITEI